MNTLCEDGTSEKKNITNNKIAKIQELTIVLPSDWIVDKGNNGKVYSTTGKSPNGKDLISIISVPGTSNESELLLETAKILDSEGKLNYTTPINSTVGNVKCFSSVGLYKNQKVEQVFVVNKNSISYYISIKSLNKSIIETLRNNISFK